MRGFLLLCRYFARWTNICSRPFMAMKAEFCQPSYGKNLVNGASRRTPFTFLKPWQHLCQPYRRPPFRPDRRTSARSAEQSRAFHHADRHRQERMPLRLRRWLSYLWRHLSARLHRHRGSGQGPHLRRVQDGRGQDEGRVRNLQRGHGPSGLSARTHKELRKGEQSQAQL